MAGGTGLVGGHMVRQLGADPTWVRVLALVRRTSGLEGGRVHEVLVDFDQLDERPEESADALAASHVFCALGTTIRKAGSREAFRRVDHDYPLALARIAAAAGARHFSLVSSVGADAASRIFYARVKGEVEAAVREAGIPSVTILRPSVLLGARDELRPGELVGKALSLLIPGRYRGVQAGDVARVALRLAAEAAPGVRVVESEEIRRLADA